MLVDGEGSGGKLVMYFKTPEIYPKDGITGTARLAISQKEILILNEKLRVLFIFCRCRFTTVTGISSLTLAGTIWTVEV
jgi:hypothetical protein